VSKTELHYLALLLFAEIHTSTHGAFGAIAFGIGGGGFVHAAKT
jgi:homoaconitase/3-isopropylmalate dehydratase large subunit